MPFTTMINQQSVDALTAKKLQESYFSKIVHIPGKGVNEGFTEDVSAASVRVVRQKLPGIATRQLGATVNGGNFNGENAKGIASDEFYIDITNVYDGNIDIAEVQEDMFSLNVVEATMENCGGEVATGVNASTIAEQIKAWANGKKAGQTAELVTLPSTIDETSYRDAVLDASAFLDDGDEANQVQIYPDDMREIIARPSFCTGLFKGKNIVVGGDLSIALLERGVIADGTYRGNGEQYVGEVNNTPIYKAPKTLWNAAANEIVFGTNTAKSGNLANTSTAKAAFDKIQALVVSAVGTLRGIAVGNRVKSIPSPIGAGLRLQPKFRWGVKCIYPSSVVPIVDNGFSVDALTNDGSVMTRLPYGSQS